MWVSESTRKLGVRTLRTTITSILLLVATFVLCRSHLEAGELGTILCVRPVNIIVAITEDCKALKTTNERHRSLTEVPVTVTKVNQTCCRTSKKKGGNIQVDQEFEVLEKEKTKSVWNEIVEICNDNYLVRMRLKDA